MCEGNVSGGGEGLPDKVMFNLRPSSVGLREKPSRHGAASRRTLEGLKGGQCGWNTRKKGVVGGVEAGGGHGPDEAGPVGQRVTCLNAMLRTDWARGTRGTSENQGWRVVQVVRQEVK